MKNLNINYEEMEYKWKGESKVLLDGKYKNYHFIILSIRGSHPCAYIELDKDHPFYGHDYDEEIFDDMPVHCGLTYSKDYLQVADIKDTWIIGWDYAHLGDYVTMPPDVKWSGKDDHKWTVEEILKHDIMPAIDWLEEIKKW